MTRRRLLLFSLPVVALPAVVGLAALSGVWLIPPSEADIWQYELRDLTPGITLENAARIQPGMTLDTVKAILGEVHRTDDSRNVTPFDIRSASMEHESKAQRYTDPRVCMPVTWLSGKFFIQVLLDRSNRVVYCDVIPLDVD
jgi:hypothetical protein